MNSASTVCYVARYIGDYHAPRLARWSSDLCEGSKRLCIAQVHERSTFYSHEQTRRDSILAKLDVTRIGATSIYQVLRGVWSFLIRTRPGHIAVIGYFDAIAAVCVIYAKCYGCRVYFMSDSKSDDQERSRFSEIIKRHVISTFDGALVAGGKHVEYFRSLGFDGPIETGFDVVDNQYFFTSAQRYRRKLTLANRIGVLPDKYFLCVSRLVHRKRVDRVLRAFAMAGIASDGWELLIVGDGPELDSLRVLCVELKIGHAVRFRMNVKNSAMPLFYSGAHGLILGSEYDQWGLCVNEAMACGVPAIVSARCGVAGEIVLNDVNGYVFDGEDIEAAGRSIYRLATDVAVHARTASACLVTIKSWGLARFSSSLLKLMGHGGTR